MTVLMLLTIYLLGNCQNSPFSYHFVISEQIDNLSFIDGESMSSQTVFDTQAIRKGLNLKTQPAINEEDDDLGDIISDDDMEFDQPISSQKTLQRMKQKHDAQHEEDINSDDFIPSDDDDDDFGVKSTKPQGAKINSG